MKISEDIQAVSSTNLYESGWKEIFDFIEFLMWHRIHVSAWSVDQTQGQYIATH